MPPDPLDGTAVRALLSGALGAGIVKVQIPPRAGVKVEMYHCRNVTSPAMSRGSGGRGLH